MPTTSSGVFMLLFSASLTVTYIVSRQSYLRPPVLWVGGLLINSTFFCLYTLTRPMMFIDALLSGLFLALIFTSTSILLGQCFRGVIAQANEAASSVLVTEN
jgi:hypothetical protein